MFTSFLVENKTLNISNDISIISTKLRNEMPINKPPMPPIVDNKSVNIKAGCSDIITYDKSS